jgi:hypothetical protein
MNAETSSRTGSSAPGGGASGVRRVDGGADPGAAPGGGAGPREVGPAAILAQPAPSCPTGDEDKYRTSRRMETSSIQVGWVVGAAPWPPPATGVAHPCAGGERRPCLNKFDTSRSPVRQPRYQSIADELHQRITAGEFAAGRLAERGGAVGRLRRQPGDGAAGPRAAREQGLVDSARASAGSWRRIRSPVARPPGHHREPARRGGGRLGSPHPRLRFVPPRRVREVLGPTRSYGCVA